MFALFSGLQALEGLILPLAVGSHAANYTAAAAAWLAGGDPWQIGPPGAIYAGPPPMLLLFVPFVPLPTDLTRLVWVVGMFLAAVWVVRRIGLPGYWVAFPPMFQAIFLGHPEVLVLALLVVGGPLSGIAAVIKPYAAAPLLAERRWSAFLMAIAVVLITAPFVPWPTFIADLPSIAANLVRQNHGDSTFGSPILIALAVLALVSLGFRRGLWLSVPLLWPLAQPMYKTASLPALSPFLAIAWSIPVPGFTLVGLLIEAIVVRFASRRPLPVWLMQGFMPAPARGPFGRPTA
ncbi:MAG: glycosyltransferase 87 family protein [Chloroflexota bacterium]